MELHAYDPGWAFSFEALSKVLHMDIADPELRIEHVGSTAIPGMPAKPILDVDIVIPDMSRLPGITAALETLGYVSRGDQGIPGRYAFRQSDVFVPWTMPKQSWMAHHLYVCLEGSLALKNHLCVREALLADPGLAASYGRLKRELADRPGMSRENYTRSKTAFLLKVLASAGFDAKALAQIADANR